MPNKLGIAFFGMMVGGAAFLISGTAVYLTIAQLQDTSRAKLQDRIIQVQGPPQMLKASFQLLTPTRHAQH